MRRLASLLALLCFCAPAFAAEPAPLPRVAISPVIPPGADDGLDLGRTFADLLAVQLSSSSQWELVERAQLGMIEDEWLVKGSGFANRAASIRLGALARADLMLEFRVGRADIEHPSCTVSVVETARAEVLAQNTLPLAARPTGPWYRSPPDADMRAISSAARETLDRAASRLAEWRGRPVAALLFSLPPAGAETEARATCDALASATEAAGFRWVNLIPGHAAETEGLLQISGLTGGAPSPWRTAADIYLWVESDQAGQAVLRHWRPGLPARTRPLRGNDAPTFTELMAAMRADAASDSDESNPADRITIARDFLKQAQARWRAAGLGEKPGNLGVHLGLIPRPDAAQTEELGHIRTLLGASAFFSPEDAEIQELRAVLELALGSTYADKIWMARRVCDVADRFWIRPDQSFDWRLCADSFEIPYNYVTLAIQRRRMVSVISVLSTLPEDVLPHFGPMMAGWLNDLFSQMEEADAALIEKFWPLALRALGDRLRKPYRPVDLLSPGAYSDFGFVHSMTDGSYPWRDKLAAIVAKSGPALNQPPAKAGANPRNKPTERLGLSVKPRVPHVIETHTYRVASGSWQRTETLDDGGVRTVDSAPPPDRPAIPSLPPTPVPSTEKAAAIEKSPLVAAARAGRWEEVDRLLEAGENLQAPTSSLNDDGKPLPAGAVLLAAAVKGDRVALANRLLDAGVRPDKSVDDRLFVVLETRAGQLTDAETALYRRLGDAGARVANSDFANPFWGFFRHLKSQRDFRETRRATSHQAAGRADTWKRQEEQEDAEALRALEQLIAVNLRDIFGEPVLDRADQEGLTPLTQAVLLEWKEGIRTLLAAGANLDRGHFEGTSTRRLLNARPALARAMQTDGPTPSSPEADQSADGPAIVAALQEGKSDFLARTAITPGALTYRDLKGWTVLHHAIDKKEEAYALRLVSAGAPLDALTKAGQSPLSFAAAMRLESVAAALLAAGASANLRSGDAPTPLFQAAFSQNPSLVRRILKAGAELEIRVGDDQRTPAHAAASRASNVPVLEVLFESGADFQARSESGDTMLDWALLNNAHQNVRYLHAKGVGWRARSPGEGTPLRKAASSGQTQMVAALLDCGHWDEAALTLASTADIKQMLEDSAVRRGSKVIDDRDLWPVICADRENGCQRALAHLANGGNIGFTGNGPTPLEMALHAMNPDLVKLLLQRGAVPRTHRDPDFATNRPTLFSLVPPEWVMRPSINNRPEFKVTAEEWDAYAAEMISLIAPHWPDPAYSELHRWLEQRKMARSLSALRAAGVPSP